MDILIKGMVQYVCIYTNTNHKPSQIIEKWNFETSCKIIFMNIITIIIVLYMYFLHRKFN